MNILNNVILQMNKEEVRGFKLFANRTNSTGDRKDLQLFDYIRKSEDKYDENKIAEKLYPGKDKNAFYRLKNRLLEDLGIAIMQQDSNDSLLNIIHNIGLHKFFHNKSNIDLAIFYLKRAEKKALQAEDFELLDMIYSSYIKLAKDNIAIDPRDFIEKRTKNQAQIKKLRLIDDMLAIINHRLRVSQNLSLGKEDIFELLQKAINDVSEDQEIINSPKLKMMIYDAVSKILLQSHDYKSLEKYLEKTYREFIKDNLFNKNNHDVKLRMVTFLVNTLFRNKKFERSLEYAQELKNAMEEFNGQLYDQYLIFYYNSLVINYSKIDKNKAVELLETLITKKQKIKSPPYNLFLYGNLSVLCFDQKEYDKALGYLVKLYQKEEYNSFDKILKLKIEITEIIIRYELKEFDYLNTRILQIRKNYKEQLIKPEYQREKELISIIRAMCNIPDLKYDASTLAKIQSFIEITVVPEIEDAEIIKYREWLGSKVH